MRGKLRPRLAPKAKDWDDVLMTIVKTGLPDAEVIAMTPRERQEAKAAGCSERGESIRVWREWFDHPTRHGIWDWGKYLESIGRMDLYRPATQR
jgi:hypothetical protein